MANRKLNSTYSRNEESLTECDLSYAVNMIGGRWKLQILHLVENRICRFVDMKKEFPLMTERMLTLQLRALEQDGLLKRTMYAELPPRVEYQLTEMALELVPILHRLSDWGRLKRSANQGITESPEATE